MTNLSKQKIGRFDQVRLLTTKNVSYLSAPTDLDADPQGVWSVAAVVGDKELLCTKSGITIRIPIADVLKTVDFNIHNITHRLGKLSHGEESKD